MTQNESPALGVAPQAGPEITKSSEQQHFKSNNNSHPSRNQSRRIDFAAINRAALARLPDILVRWLPDGRCRGHEYVARNPRRADRHAGSFSVNLVTGRWADFASDARGGDLVSLAAYLFDLPQGAAARRLAEMLGVEHA